MFTQASTHSASSTRGSCSPLAERSVASPTRPLDMLLVFLLVLLSSGNPAFLPMGNIELTLVPSAILLFILLLSLKHPHIKRGDIAVFAIFLCLNLIHVAVLQMTAVYTAFGFFVRLFIAFAVVRITGNSTVAIVRVLTALAALATIVFAIDSMLGVFGVDLAVVLDPISIHTGSNDVTYAILHNFHAAEDRERNSGIFWEPGALAGYCLLGLTLWGVSIHRYSMRQSCVIVASLVTALLTTFSTTGYALLPFALLTAVFSRMKVRPSTIIASTVIGLPVLAVLLIQIAQLPFVQQKISDQIFAVESESKNWQLNRIGQLLNDVEDIMARPLTGWGVNPRATPSADAAALEEDIQTAQGNGVSRFMVQFGLIGFGTFVCIGYRNFRRSEHVRAAAAFWAIFVVCLTLSGEMFQNYPLFMSLMFLPNSESRGFRVWVSVNRRQPASSPQTV